MPAAASPPDVPAFARRLRAGDRATLARAITLVESKRADHQQAAHQLVQELVLAGEGRSVLWRNARSASTHDAFRAGVD